MTQAQTLAVLKTGANVFLTGEPGSGKTHTVNLYTNYLMSCGIEPAITASTGIAATHIGGMTIHSWSGIGARDSLSPYDLDSISTNKRIVKRLESARVLIIDEISMLSSSMLDCVEVVCRTLRRNHEPFGGLQVILVGDFFQLPPVVKRDTEREQYVDMFEEKKSIFAYDSFAWGKSNPVVCYLNEQHRQEDPEFLAFLTAVRRNEVKSEHKALLRTRYKKAPQTQKITQLYSRNASVDYINAGALKELRGSPTVFTMDSQGPDHLVATLKRGCLSPETLSLKVGARVMFTKNDPAFTFVNGTTGVIDSFDKDSGYPIVRTVAGAKVTALPMQWSIQDEGRVLASVSQVPLRLAWAITVHKSQGMSLCEAHLDLSDCFEYGQGYVALSRVRTLAGLTLSGLNERALEVHPDIIEKDTEFREISDEARERFGDIKMDYLATMHSNFVKACGGKEGSGRGVRVKVKKPSTYQITQKLVAGGVSIDDIAKERGLSFGTIVSHLEILLSQKKISANDLLHIKPSYFKEVHDALIAVHKKTGEMRLTPVRVLLGERYDYDQIRIARLFVGG
ncbi:MAG: helix-turn-helix domain-containing protein [bacterium]|nr:helix-turn-helix domain-containing protein [bacterium]